MDYDAQMDNIQTVLDTWEQPRETLQGSEKALRSKRAVNLHSDLHQVAKHVDDLNAEQKQRLLAQTKKLLTYGFGIDEKGNV